MNVNLVTLNIARLELVHQTIFLTKKVLLIKIIYIEITHEMFMEFVVLYFLNQEWIKSKCHLILLLYLTINTQKGNMKMSL